MPTNYEMKDWRELEKNPQFSQSEIRSHFRRNKCDWSFQQIFDLENPEKIEFTPAPAKKRNMLPYLKKLKNF